MLGEEGQQVLGGESRLKMGSFEQLIPSHKSVETGRYCIGSREEAKIQRSGLMNEEGISL